MAGPVPAFNQVVLVQSGAPTGFLSGTVLPLAVSSTVAPGAYHTFGGATDVWHTTNLRGIDVNSPSFGVAFNVQSSTIHPAFNTVFVDHVRVTVYYASPIQLSAPVGGSITLSVGRKYFYAFRNSYTGHISDLSLASDSTGPLAVQDQPLTNIAASLDPQVDKKIILGTEDGGDETKLHFIAEIPNSTTTFTDNITEDVLLQSPLFQDILDDGTIVGIADNLPPPNMTQPFKHRGRIYGIVGQYLYFSKSQGELTTSDGTICGKYEECWPGSYYMDISENAETIRAAMSDGVRIYVASERCIRVIDGDGPDNFSEPQILFNNVGVLSPEVWQHIFVEGKPVGTIWMTPDRKIIGSDFNTYSDIGAPITDVLNTINQSAIANSCAMYLGSGRYDMYILAIPTGSNTDCDTLCVYDLRVRKWFIWSLADNVTSLFYNIDSTGTPQPLIIASTGKIYQIGSNYNQDRVSDTPVSITSTIQTPWMEFGEPKLRKLINELEIMTGDPSILVSVDGASTRAEFDSPVNVVSGASLTTSPLGEFKVYLASKTARDRYYRLKFVSTSTAANVLDSWSAEVLAVHRN